MPRMGISESNMLDGNLVELLQLPMGMVSWQTLIGGGGRSDAVKKVWDARHV